MKNSLKMVNNIILVFCVIFSVTTLASCIINLAMGNMVLCQDFGQ